MSSSSQRIVIIGAGPCGLGAAWRLKELGHKSYHVLEASQCPGGLSITERDDEGFLWDMGGHVIFVHYEYVSRLFDHVVHDWCERERVCYIWMKNRFIPYPFQNNVHRLPEEDLQCCLDGLIDLERRKASMPKPTSFHQWLENGFGSGIMDLFLLPYNRKVWGYDPSQMNTEWMGERVATVDLKRITANVLSGKDDSSWGPNNKFRFPLRGGTGAIYASLYEQCDASKFRLNAKVTSVNADKKELTLADGSVVEYDALVSTMPLDALCKIIKGSGLEDLPAKAPQFKYSSTHVVGIGIEGQPPEKLRAQCWMYFPEDDCPFYRVTVFSNYSPYHVPKPRRQWSLMAEVCETRNRPVDVSTIVDQVVQGFYNTKLLLPSDHIVSRFHRLLEHGYPTPFLGRDELCRPIFEELEKRSIFSRGRFGAWKYEVSNQDHTVMQGVEVVDHLLYGSEEMTFRFPSVVNHPSWKSVGRVPRVPCSATRTYNPLKLVERMRDCSLDESVKNVPELKVQESIQESSSAAKLLKPVSRTLAA